ncbi:hypothetical protein [Clostridium sp.]|uniref:hypothetical protein n=1 Tax=Clostridium sp. TaxID=1506 RepID=UPI002FCA8753
MGITPPIGNPTGKIPGIFSNGEEIRIDMEGSIATIQYFVSYVNGDQFVNILIRDVKSGLWKISLFGEYIVNGRYDAWLFQRDLLYEETKFMVQDPLITLMIPNTSMNILSASYFDSKTATPAIKGGKGFTRDGRIKPEVGVLGTDVLTTGINGQNIIVSGSAVAGAILCGAVALIMQWGLVEKNDVNLFTPKIRTYLIRSVIQQAGVSYPNPESGYGLLSFEKLFENLQNGNL